MEIHFTVNHVSAKRLWNVIRIAFFMMRKGLISKRKMLMDMHLMMERGKGYGRSLMNLVFQHFRGNSQGGYGLQEYEFSCSNSPVNPVLLHMGKRKHHHFPTHILHFPCMNPPPDEDDKEESNAFVLSPSDCNNEYFSKDCLDHDLPSLQKLNPLLSPLSERRISRSSSEENNDHQVDRQAEEFIAKFYEQLRLQNQMSLLQYQEMLVRGTI